MLHNLFLYKKNNREEESIKKSKKNKAKMYLLRKCSAGPVENYQKDIATFLGKSIGA